MLTIESLKEFSELKERDFTKDGVTKKLYSQDLFVHLGGPFPEKINVSLDTPDQLLPVGKYTLTQDSFRVGQYDRLEINSFNLRQSLVKAG